MTSQSALDRSGFMAGCAVARRDHLQVEDLRRAMAFREQFGGSWLAAAKVVGCSEHALRQACDPTYVAVHAPARAVVAFRALNREGAA